MATNNERREYDRDMKRRRVDDMTTRHQREGHSRLPAAAIDRADAASNPPWIVHVTDGGAVYISDNHNFSKATFAIRMDGDPARAAQIVREHNAHDALVAIARKLNERYTFHEQDEKELRAALKLASYEECPYCAFDGVMVTTHNPDAHAENDDPALLTVVVNHDNCDPVVEGDVCQLCGTVLKYERQRRLTP